MAASSAARSITSSTSRSSAFQKPFPAIPSPSFLSLPTNGSTKFPTQINSSKPRFSPIAAASSDASPAISFHGLCYVLGDNIDTDQIIPAEYCTLVPSKPDEYKQLGSYALSGLPSTYTTRFVEEGEVESKYKIIIGGNNFGCGSSREHAPVALGSAGAVAVVAESYARIFFRNSVSTGEIYPLDSEVRVCEECRTGDLVTIQVGESKLINHRTGKVYKLKPIGDVGPVIEAGGIFPYVRKAGMIPNLAPQL